MDASSVQGGCVTETTPFQVACMNYYLLDKKLQKLKEQVKEALKECHRLEPPNEA